MTYPNLNDLGIDVFGFGVDDGSFFNHTLTVQMLAAMNSRYNDGYTGATIAIGDPWIGQGESRQLHPWIFAAHQYWRALGYFTEIDISQEVGGTAATFFVSWSNPDFNENYIENKVWEVPGLVWNGSTTAYKIDGWQARDAYLMQTRGNDLRRITDKITIDDIYKRLRLVQVYGTTPKIIYVGPYDIFRTLNRDVHPTNPRPSTELYKKRLSKTFENVRQILTTAGFVVTENFSVLPENVCHWVIEGTPVNPNPPEPDPDPTP